MQLRRGQIDDLDRRTPVIIPTAAVEQHGEHLPVGTDCMINRAITDRLIQAMEGRILVMPMVQVTCSEHHMVWPGSLTLTHETYSRTVMEYVDAIQRNGFTRVMILNSHGGNQAINAVLDQKLGQRYQNVECLVGSWWNIAAPRIQSMIEGKGLSCGHACEFETSLVLAIAKELVDMTIAKDGGNPQRVDSMNFDLFGGGVASSYQDYKEATRNGVLGKPTLASPQKGEQILAACVQSIQELIEGFWKDV